MRRFFCMLSAGFAALTAGASITHTASMGPSAPGATSVDITMSTPAGDDWNSSQIAIVTIRDVTIVSPDDNPFGVWTPPLPDDGLTLDTYVRTPSSPIGFPNLVIPNYVPTAAYVTWFDNGGAVSPPTFLGARVGFNSENAATFNLAGLGREVGMIHVDSTTQLGGGNLTTNDWIVYDGAPGTSDLTHSLVAGPTSANLVSFDLMIDTGAGDNWDRGSITITTSPGTTIIDPTNNGTSRKWRMPLSGSQVDTFLVAPSSIDGSIGLSNDSYTSTAASASWRDPFGTTAPSTFMAARIGLALPPGYKVSNSGTQVAMIHVESATAEGGSNTVSSDFPIFAEVEFQPALRTRCGVHENGSVLRVEITDARPNTGWDLLVDGAIVRSGETDDDGVAKAKVRMTDGGTHEVTVNFDDGTSATKTTTCE